MSLFEIFKPTEHGLAPRFAGLSQDAKVAASGDPMQMARFLRDAASADKSAPRR